MMCHENKSSIRKVAYRISGIGRTWGHFLSMEDELQYLKPTIFSGHWAGVLLIDFCSRVTISVSDENLREFTKICIKRVGQKVFQILENKMRCPMWSVHNGSYEYLVLGENFRVSWALRILGTTNVRETECRSNRTCGTRMFGARMVSAQRGVGCWLSEWRLSDIALYHTVIERTSTLGVVRICIETHFVCAVTVAVVATSYRKKQHTRASSSCNTAADALVPRFHATFDLIRWPSLSQKEGFC